MKWLDCPSQGIQEKILSMLPQYGYKGLQDGNGILIESSLSEPAFEFVRIASTNVAEANYVLERYQAEYSKVTEYVMPYTKCLEFLSKIAKEVSLENVESFKRAVMFCPRTKLPQLFNEGVAPLFFGSFAGGEIDIIKTSPSYWGRAAFKRFLYTLFHYPEAVVGGEIEEFASLKAWNSLQPDDFLAVTLRLIQYLFFPYVSGFSTGHGIGLVFVFIPPASFKHGRPLFPADWIDFMRPDTELGEEKRPPINDSSALFTKSERSIYGKYLFEQPPSVDDVRGLLKWGIQAVNDLLTKIYDVTRFPAENPADSIDPIYGQEYALSLMHVLKDAASIIAQDSRYGNKTTTFRIADILSAMAEHGSPGKRQDEFFRELLSCKEGKLKIRSILCNTGIPALEKLAQVSDQIYDNLKRVISESVFVQSKSRPDGILVRDSSLRAEHLTSEDEFCVNVLRALRNTQHGYFTRGDRAFRPSRFLSLVDGNTPDDLPTLALCWTLALLASPRELIGNP